MNVRRSLAAFALNAVAVVSVILVIQWGYGAPVNWGTAAVIVVAATLGLAVGEWLRSPNRRKRAQ